MEIISYAHAKAHGLVRYYSGEPCLHGHVAERQTSNRRCLGCPQTKTVRVPKKAKPAAVAPSRVSTAALTRHDCPKCGPNVLFVGFTCLHCKRPLGGKTKGSKSYKLPLWRDYATVPA